MAKVHVQGLAPYLAAARPRAPARWWAATGVLERGRLKIQGLEESERPPAVAGRCGLAAPCSLPAPFLEYLGAARSLDVDVPLDRLLKGARIFAAAATRGRRHPLRFPLESLPALDRRRLPLFFAALPLLKSNEAARIFEVDVPAVLRARGLPHAGLAGSRPAAVVHRARILAALDEGALGFPVAVAARDLAVASLPALKAVVAAAMAAWVEANAPARPPGAETWVPLP